MAKRKYSAVWWGAVPVGGTRPWFMKSNMWEIKYWSSVHWPNQPFKFVKFRIRELPTRKKRKLK